MPATQKKIEKAPKPAAKAPSADQTAAAPGERGRQRKLIGKVINDTESKGRTQKTVVVEVVRSARDPFYGKYVKQKKKYHAHDEKHEFKKNDVVEISACRPRSRTKRWEVVRLVERPPED